ncbi:MAG: hypothetical protein H7240_00245 [Glaciimonas sp.]|nr:hypothetical protein [Glaciimonas sp.]
MAEALAKKYSDLDLETLTFGMLEARNATEPAFTVVSVDALLETFDDEEDTRQRVLYPGIPVKLKNDIESLVNVDRTPDQLFELRYWQKEREYKQAYADFVAVAGDAAVLAALYPDNRYTAMWWAMRGILGNWIGTIYRIWHNTGSSILRPIVLRVVDLFYRRATG